MPEQYQIRIEGQLSDCWQEQLGGMTITALENGQTLIIGQLADQAALSGLINRICDLNLKIVTVEKIFDQG